MNITSAKKLISIFDNEFVAILVTIDGVEMSVPIDPANRHYAAIMEQVSAGTLTIAEADNGE